MNARAGHYAGQKDPKGLCRDACDRWASHRRVRRADKIIAHRILRDVRTDRALLADH